MDSHIEALCTKFGHEHGMNLYVTNMHCITKGYHIQQHGPVLGTKWHSPLPKKLSDRHVVVRTEEGASA